jgi:DNA-binding transcriptional LysR family regulator
VTDACSARGFQPHVAFESDDYLAVQGLVAARVGVALIPDLALSSVRDDIVIRPLSPRPIVRRVMAATLPEPLRSPATTAMVDILRGVAQDYPRQRAELAVA